ncbi:MAG: segregation and condensation protein A [Fusobacteriaceae bacterium]
MEIILNLENFQGPLDLLLHLVDKKKIKLSDISIINLIDDYIEIIEKMKNNNLTLKVEFILIASELLELKALDLIKSEQKNDKEQDLKRRLEEYKIIKELSIEISKLENHYNVSYSKTEGKKIIKKSSKEYILKDLKQMDLFIHYQKYLDVKENEFLELNLEKNYSMEDEFEKIYLFIVEKTRSIEEIFQRAHTKLHLIYLFLSILELYKEGMIEINENIISKKGVVDV